MDELTTIQLELGLAQWATDTHLQTIFDACEKANKANENIQRAIKLYDTDRCTDEEYTEACEVGWFYSDLLEWLNIHFA